MKNHLALGVCVLIGITPAFAQDKGFEVDSPYRGFDPATAKRDLDNWRNCVVDAAALTSASEPSDTVLANKAFLECKSLEGVLDISAPKALAMSFVDDDEAKKRIREIKSQTRDVLITKIIPDIRRNHGAGRP